MRINLRLNDEKDADIIRYLNNFKNVSMGIRLGIRLGMNSSLTSSTPTAKITLDEVTCAEETPCTSSMIEDSDVLDNIMSTMMLFE